METQVQMIEQLEKVLSNFSNNKEMFRSIEIMIAILKKPDIATINNYTIFTGETMTISIKMANDVGNDISIFSKFADNLFEFYKTKEYEIFSKKIYDHYQALTTLFFSKTEKEKFNFEELTEDKIKEFLEFMLSKTEDGKFVFVKSKENKDFRNKITKKYMFENNFEIFAFYISNSSNFNHNLINLDEYMESAENHISKCVNLAQFTNPYTRKVLAYHINEHFSNKFFDKVVSIIC
jgi:hypothetical protein